MPSKQAQELRDLDQVDLLRELEEAQTELINVRFGLATRQTENTARINQVKRKIARIKTILTEREQEQEA